MVIISSIGGGISGRRVMRMGAFCVRSIIRRFTRTNGSSGWRRTVYPSSFLRAGWIRPRKPAGTPYANSTWSEGGTMSRRLCIAPPPVTCKPGSAKHDAGALHVDANSDYGTSFVNFMVQFGNEVNRRTTVLILGDGRGNGHDPEPEALADLARVHADRCPGPLSGQAGRTTATPQVACAIMDLLVDPISMPANPPRPRLPTTTRDGRRSLRSGWAHRSSNTDAGRP